MTSEQEIRFLGDLTRVSLKAGDTLVLSTHIHISAEVAHRIREEIGRVVPGHEVIILSDGLKLGVLEAA